MLSELTVTPKIMSEMNLFTLRLCMTQMEWLDSQWVVSLWHGAILFLKVLMHPLLSTPNGSSPTQAFSQTLESGCPGGMFSHKSIRDYELSWLKSCIYPSWYSGFACTHVMREVV